MRQGPLLGLCVGDQIGDRKRACSAEGDAIRGDPEPATGLCNGPHKARGSRLGTGVYRQMRLSDAARVRDDGHDPPIAAFDHQRHRVAGTVQHPVVIRGHPTTPFGWVRFPERHKIVKPGRRPGVARIVDQDINAAKGSLRFGKGCANGLEIGYVKCQRKRLDACGFHLRSNAFCALGVEIIDHNGASSVLRQIQRDLTAHPLSGTGYKCGTALDVEQFTHSLSLSIQAISCDADSV